jgi:hypothetical protein
MRKKTMATFALSAIAASATSVTACPSTHAQAPITPAPQVSGVSDLADMRVEIVKAALQLTPDQEKFWPAVETRFALERRTDRTASQKWPQGSMKCVSAPPSNCCVTVIRSASYTDAPKPCLNEPPTSKNSPMHGNHSIRRLARIRGCGWPSLRFSCSVS